MRRLKILGIVLVLILFGTITVAPLLFLFCGSLMGEPEITQHLAPILNGTKGYASWRLFPLYPTLKSVVELVFDSPEFFQMFWNTMKITGGILLGDNALRVSGLKQASYDGYFMGDHCTRRVLDVYGFSDVPLFLRDTGGTFGGGTHGRRGRMEDLLFRRGAAWFRGNPFGACDPVSGVFQHDRAAACIFADEAALAAVHVSSGD